MPDIVTDVGTEILPEIMAEIVTEVGRHKETAGDRAERAVQTENTR